MSKAIIHADIYDYCDYIPDAYVIYDSQILQVGTMQEFDRLPEPPDEVIDGTGMLLMPGQIIGHSHIYSAFSRGATLQPFGPRTFTERLNQLWWRLDAQYDLDACYQSARAYGIEYLKSGVTTVFDHHAGGFIRGSLEQIRRGLVEEIGVRGLLCFETSDRFHVEDCIQENVSFAKENQGGMCRGMFGMHAGLTLSEETLRRVAGARGEIPIHVHAGESVEEEIESINRYGMRSVERYAEAGLLDENSLLAHCTNIDEREAELIGAYKSTVAINPTANLNSNNGLPDCGMFKRLGLNVIIGTDSLGTNITTEYQNTYYIMQTRLNDRTTKKFTKEDLRGYIRNVYQFASKLLHVKLGRIQPGYEADMILVPYHITTDMTQSNAFSYVMAGVFTHFFPKYVMVGGKNKVVNFESVFDEARIFSDSRQAARKMWNRIGGIS